MTDDSETDVSASVTSRHTQTNRAVAHFERAPPSAHFEVQMTPLGLLAVGALVSAILLSVAPIVAAATRRHRHR